MARYKALLAKQEDVLVEFGREDLRASRLFKGNVRHGVQQQMDAKHWPHTAAVLASPPPPASPSVPVLTLPAPAFHWPEWSDGNVLQSIAGGGFGKRLLVRAAAPLDVRAPGFGRCEVPHASKQGPSARAERVLQLTGPTARGAHAGRHPRCSRRYR